MSKFYVKVFKSSHETILIRFKLGPKRFSIFANLSSVAMAGVIKKATGLTGLAVVANPNHTLSTLYGKIMRAVSKMPQDAAYRKYTERIVSERAKIVASTKDVKQIEDQINCGQVEELIVQAQNELVLARKMLGWKPWEPLVTQAPSTQWQWPPAQLKQIQH